MSSSSSDHVEATRREDARERHSEPQEKPHGGIDAVFQGGCSNLLDSHQEERGGK